MILLEVVEIPGYVTLIISTLAAIAGFFAGYVYLRTGIENKKAEGYKSLFEIEEKRAERYLKELTEVRQAHLSKINDYELLANEYGQLSELFAKKSIILEVATNNYAGAVAALEAYVKQNPEPVEAETKLKKVLKGGL